MDYYGCPMEALRKEIQRRAIGRYGSRDEFSERLHADDDARGSEATTVATTARTAVELHGAKPVRRCKSDETTLAEQLVGQSKCSLVLSYCIH
jgi:hypothetical protein